MGYYAIGIGGTGAKCLESLVHLAASGMVPDGELYLLFVDPDTANGSLARAQQTLNHYVACKDTLQLGQTSLLKTRIVSAEPNLWTPLENQPQPRLDQFFHYDALRVSNDDTRVAAAHLFEALYSKKERETTLEYGFRGHPSIGSAVMAKTVNLGEEDPWRTFRQQLANDTNAKVFLAGSIFGGTGASGFPTIARLVSNELEDIGVENVKLGGALVLPYFYFLSEDNELQAKSEVFLMNTQAALKYYHLWNQTGIYDSVYLLGDESRTEVENALGGQNQQNAPHFIELYAALAAIHFFGTRFEANQPAQYFMTARRQNNLLQWEDLPDGDNGNTIRSKIGQLARFAFAYLSIYQPTLQKIRDEGKGYRAPWFVDFFERNQVQINDNQTQILLRNVETYCQDFLLWCANIQNCVEDETIELVEYGAYAKRDERNPLELKPVNSFASKDFSNLIQPRKKEEPNAFNKLWERMSDGRGEVRNAQGLGKFLSALYNNCSE